MSTRTLILAAAWLFSGLVYADTPPPPQSQHQHRGPDMDRLATLLDLGDQQKAEVQKVLQAQHQQMQAAMQNQHASDQALRQQMQKDTIDKLSAILNEQQLKKFEALAQHPPGKHGHWGDSSGQQQAPAQH